MGNRASQPVNRRAASSADQQAVRQHELAIARWLHDSARAGVMTTDTELRVVNWNDWLADRTGLPRAEVLGRSIFELFPDLIERGLDQLYHAALAGQPRLLSQRLHGYLFAMTTDHAVAGAEQMQQSAQIAALITDTGIAGTLTVIEDVTERVVQERQLRAQLERLEQLTAELRRKEMWLATTLHSIGDGVIATDAQCKVTLLNARASELTGWPAPQASGRALTEVFQIIDSVTRAPVENPAALALREGRVIEVADHSILLGKDGEARHIDNSAAPIYDCNGDAIGTVLVFRDVTRQRSAERALRLSEAQLRLIADSLPVHIMRLDNQLRYRFVNNTYAARFGLLPEQLIGKTLAEVVGDPADTTVLPYLQRVLAGEPVQFERMFSYPQLGQRYMRSANVADIDEDGRVRGIIGVMMDLTDVKLTQDKLEAADRRKDEFLAMLGHELRNPLAPIRNAVSMLSPTMPLERLHWIREIVQRQVRHLSRLVDDLLDVARITQGKIGLQLERLELAPLIAAAVEVVRPQIDGKRQTLAVTLPADPLWVHGDQARLTQVIGNLLSNAAKYTQAGGQLQIELARAADGALIEVRDNGYGIDSDLLPHVFSLFTQGHQALDRAQGGLGVGLSLVKTLVDLHGGTVDAHSDGHHRGSLFSVRLPLSPGPGAADGAANDTCAPARAAPRRTILVVDDNIDAAETLCALLELAGHQVRIAHDATRALEIVATLAPDVALLDIGLPGMDGLELARRLRRLPQTKQSLLVALTGYGGGETRESARQAGFDHHIVKPIEPSQLDQLIAQHGFVLRRNV